MPAEAYPVRVEASLGPQLFRWMRSVKWLSAIPSSIVLLIAAGPRVTA